MSATHTIQFLERKHIDTTKWDRCIEQAGNGLVYGYSFYLDAMATHWAGLVSGDYEAVMPLPYRRKFLIYYLYQPFLTAQLGVFGNQITAKLLQDFFDAIPSKFKLWEFPLNHGNLVEGTSYPLYVRKNYVLDLNQSYEVLYNDYRDNIKRNIRKSQQYGCYAKKDIPLQEVISLAAQIHPEEKGLKDFESLYSIMHAKGQAICYGMYSDKQQLLASCALLFSHNRAYYLLVGNHPNGRTLGASHALIDAFIKDHTGQPLLLDFEGSDIRNLAFFYSGFGAREENYAAIQWNRLPWYVKLLKK